MTTSNTGLNLIRLFEGYRDRAYLCAAGCWTCGYGHTRGVTAQTTCTQEIATMWLIDDVRGIESELRFFDISQGEFDALVSLIYNIGIGNWRKSTLRKYIAEDKDLPFLHYEWLRWRWVSTDKGKKPLLLKRREKEFEIFKAARAAAKNL